MKQMRSLALPHLPLEPTPALPMAQREPRKGDATHALNSSMANSELLPITQLHLMTQIGIEATDHVNRLQWRVEGDKQMRQPPFASQPTGSSLGQPTPSRSYLFHTHTKRRKGVLFVAFALPQQAGERVPSPIAGISPMTALSAAPKMP